MERMKKERSEQQSDVAKRYYQYGLDLGPQNEISNYKCFMSRFKIVFPVRAGNASSKHL